MEVGPGAVAAAPPPPPRIITVHFRGPAEMSQPLQYHELAEALGRLGYTQDAAEYHGALCGALCVREPQAIDPLKLLPAQGASDGGPEPAAVLARLRSDAATAFTGPEMGFAPLLPDDDTELPLRVRSLTAWCEGFLFGLATGKPLNMKTVSPEMKEILRDFTEFTNAGLSEDEDGEVEETAYAELVEYIRVGAQLVFLELHERQPDASRASTVH